ncbi:hypothetical protein MQE22_08745 [Acidithiobacillus sp. YTS05]|nr:hypothetical protein MQE22_08745 [Acidithiobacillus sp. YTS05]
MRSATAVPSTFGPGDIWRSPQPEILVVDSMLESYGNALGMLWAAHDARSGNPCPAIPH